MLFFNNRRFLSKLAGFNRGNIATWATTNHYYVIINPSSELD